MGECGKKRVEGTRNMCAMASPLGQELVAERLVNLLKGKVKTKGLLHTLWVTTVKEHHCTNCTNWRGGIRVRAGIGSMLAISASFSS